MGSISESVKKKDHEEKIGGYARYVDDLMADMMPDGMLYGRLLRSSKARARIRQIHVPLLPDGYMTVDKNDVNGSNHVHIVLDDMPVFAEDKVEYYGEPILMVVGPDMKIVKRIIQEIKVEYQEQDGELPVLDMMTSDMDFFKYAYAKGDIDHAMAKADHILTETFQTGHQEHVYIETQGIIAYPCDEKIVVRGSMQCPHYVHTAVTQALGCSPEEVRVIQDVTGGGFGGKEDFPSILGCQAAVAAKKTNRPVKIIFDRREDMAYSSKRHPSVCTYQAAIKDGMITGMAIDICLDSGAYTTLSPVVLQRGVISASGVYRIKNLRVTGRAVKTNSVPCGAFRGFGAPQVFFGIETMMDHIAIKLGVDPLEFKEKHIVKQGDATSTEGRYHFHVPLPEMMKRMDEISDYRAKYNRFQVQSGRYRKGIGQALFFHGCGFTGNGERDLIKAVARLQKTTADTVEILVGTTDIGQGSKTTFCKIVANTLEIPDEDVFFANPDTDRVTDAGPTVASRSIMIVGELLRRAAERLKKEWKVGEENVIEEHYTEPDFRIPFDFDEFKGDAYPTYSWGVNTVETEVDLLTAESRIIGVWGIYDVGIPIDLNIIMGQMQGGLVQGLGYAAMEQMDYSDLGMTRNNNLGDYLIPTAADIPEIVTEIINNPYPYGPFGAKGAGELAFIGAAPAYIQALENALGANVNKIPFTLEDIMKIIRIKDAADEAKEVGLS